MDKSWMKLRNRLSPEYRKGVSSFIKFAVENAKSDIIPCPCKDCLNCDRHSSDLVENHLVSKGIATTYTTWLHHGEHVAPSNSHVSSVRDGEQNEIWEDELSDLLEDQWMAAATFVSDDDPGGFGDTVEREDVQNFDQILNKAKQELYPGCQNFTVLSFVIKMLHLKVLNKWSNKAFDMLMGVQKELLPECNQKIPQNTYEAKKFLRDLGLGYVSIPACKWDCALFWKENVHLENCPICGESRYKINDGKGKKIPHKVLRYFPLTPNLQRLYMSRKTAADMGWHKNNVADDGIMRHPCDGEAWKDFDKTHPLFSQESRNVRLGLATDGFNPFGNMSTSYSVWPLIVMPYNLPPWKCMKEPYCFMSLLIPGPKAPGRDIDVFLRPLIDELNELWEIGVRTYDASTKQRFQMHAAVMWTINDFPAYGNLSGWSTKGYKACPNCNEDASSQKLLSKIGYTGARRFLAEDHPWRDDLQFDNNVDHRSRPIELTGEQVLHQLNSGTHRPYGKNPNQRKRKRDETKVLNYTKKSIFFELPYWKTLKLRHNLDVMHIEKNICDSLLGTLLSIDGKDKDTEKARMDLANMQIREELHLRRRPDGKLDKPQAEYALSSKDRLGFCEFLKSVEYPDGYAANISRCVNMEGGKLLGLKSHDCHVLIQRLLPLGMRRYLKKEIYTMLFEIGNFFQQLCSKSLGVEDLKELQKHIVLILCKMELIFPPAFFDVMVHLAIHLPREAILGGPVQYRWMYPIERLLGTLKKHVSNRARPEGSIAEGYIVKQSLTFCSMYLGGIETIFNREERNHDGGERGQGLAAFNQNVRPFGRMARALDVSEKARELAHWFVLDNTTEVDSHMREHMDLLESGSSRNIAKRQQQEFPMWFRERMNRLRGQSSPEATNELWALANGPDAIVNIYSGCICNGVRFHTKDRDSHRQCQNSGLVVEGMLHEGEKKDFYGYLSSVWVMKYMQYEVVLFQCEWYNVGSNRTFHTDEHVTSIDIRSRWYKNDPFVLPIHARQVFYVDDTKSGEHWKFVERVKHRGIWDIPEPKSAEPSDLEFPDSDVVFQQEETVELVPINLSIPTTLSRDDVEPQIISRATVLQDNSDNVTGENDDLGSNDDDESTGERMEEEEEGVAYNTDTETDVDSDMES